MIDKNIPAPAAHGRNRSTEFPLREMEIGDSYFHAGSFRSTNDSKAYRLAALIQRRQKEYKFVGRAVTEDNIAGVRIWRVPATPAEPKRVAPPTPAQTITRPKETDEEMTARINARFKHVRHSNYDE